jgi:REP element-mobilizing transposase RayT
MNRGSGRRQVFADDVDRRTFLYLLGDLERRNGVEAHAYCLMGNHYHLLLRSATGQLSPAMQHLGAVFTRRANWRRGVDGPIFRSRFHSVRLEHDAHLTELLRYIHRNPLDVGWDRPLVDYPWSSHGAHAGRRRPAPPWLHTELVRELFGSRVATYQAFVDQAAPVGPAGPVPIECDRPAAPILAAGAGGVPVAIADIADAVATVSGTPRSAISTPTPGAANDARLVALLLAASVTTAPAAELAGAFGFRSAGSVRSALTRARRLLDVSVSARRLASDTVQMLGLPAESLLAS